MDLDKIMEGIYARPTRDQRVTEALSVYVDILNDHGDSSPEEQKLYAVTSTIFPELKVLFDRSKYLKAAFAGGKFDLLPGDLEAVGLKDE